MLNHREPRHSGSSKNSPSSSPKGHRMIVCDPSALATGLLDGADTSNFCTVETPNTGVLIDAILSLSPDIVLLSKQTLEEVLKRIRCKPDTEGDLQSALVDLPTRQAEVVQLLTKGLRNREIATTLGLSSRTIKATLSALYMRYDVTNRTELLGRLVEEGHTHTTRPDGGTASGTRTPFPSLRADKTVNRVKFAL